MTSGFWYGMMHIQNRENPQELGMSLDRAGETASSRPVRAVLAAVLVAVVVLQAQAIGRAADHPRATAVPVAGLRSILDMEGHGHAALAAFGPVRQHTPVRPVGIARVGACQPAGIGIPAMAGQVVPERLLRGGQGGRHAAADGAREKGGGVRPARRVAPL